MTSTSSTLIGRVAVEIDAAAGPRGTRHRAGRARRHGRGGRSRLAGGVVPETAQRSGDTASTHAVDVTSEELFVPLPIPSLLGMVGST